MHGEGYEWASFVDDKWKYIKDIKKPNCYWPMPDSGIYFSKILEPEEGGDERYRDWRTGWSEWLNDEDFNIDKFSKRGILFAKIDVSMLFVHKDCREEKVDWGSISKDHPGAKLYLNIEQVCIW